MREPRGYHQLSIISMDPSLVASQSSNLYRTNWRDSTKTVT